MRSRARSSSPCLLNRMKIAPVARQERILDILKPFMREHRTGQASES